MPTLLLNSRFTEDSQKLWRACIGMDWKVERVHNWKIPDGLSSDVAIYGEPLFTQHVARALNLKLLEPALGWLPQLGIQYAGRAIDAMTLAEARNISRSVFIKPANEKAFDAKIYLSGKELPAAGVYSEDMPVLVQSVVEWECEYRCFILDQQVKTISPYWRNGQLAQTESGEWQSPIEEFKDAEKFCNIFLNAQGMTLPRAIVVDVGMIRGHGWAVIESNAASSSGVYGCDPISVLEVLRHAVQPS